MRSLERAGFRWRKRLRVLGLLELFGVCVCLSGLLKGFRFNDGCVKFGL